jgi:hypothetical protein
LLNAIIVRDPVGHRPMGLFCFKIGKSPQFR